MSACVSPPQLRVSHIVEVAAIIAQAASTALPPLMKMRAPAVAASGLPVMATQFCPCRTGLTVFAVSGVVKPNNANITAIPVGANLRFIGAVSLWVLEIIRLFGGVRQISIT